MTLLEGLWAIPYTGLCVLSPDQDWLRNLVVGDSARTLLERGWEVWTANRSQASVSERGSSGMGWFICIRNSLGWRRSQERDRGGDRKSAAWADQGHGVPRILEGALSPCVIVRDETGWGASIFSLLLGWFWLPLGMLWACLPHRESVSVSSGLAGVIWGLSIVVPPLHAEGLGTTTVDQKGQKAYSVSATVRALGDSWTCTTNWCQCPGS